DARATSPVYATITDGAPNPENPHRRFKGRITARDPSHLLAAGPTFAVGAGKNGEAGDQVWRQPRRGGNRMAMTEEQRNLAQGRLAPGDPKRVKVLLVEDAPFLRYAFGRLLRMHGFDVREANDGSEALDAVGQFHPQLILTDLMMPVMDGVELI